MKVEIAQEVNKKLVFGEKLEGYYWSSTEYSNNYAWVLSMGSGYRGTNSKGSSGYVRPVLTIKL